MTNQERFTQIFQEKITREGADKLLEFLEKSDFFTAPASTRYHGAYEGGLVAHSLNVYDCLVDILNRPRMKELYGVGVLFYNVAAAHSVGKGEELGKEVFGEAHGRANLTVGSGAPYKRAFAFC